MGKSVENVTIIGGADGPTSVFLVGKKKGRESLKNRVRSFWYMKRKKRVESRIVARPHTLEEVVRFFMREYGAAELSAQSRRYQEEKKCLKESLILRQRPELLGELAKIEFPKEVSESESSCVRAKEGASGSAPAERLEREKAILKFQEQIRLRSRRAEEIPDSEFPMDFHIYEAEPFAGARVQLSLETRQNILGVSWSGPRKQRRQLKRISQRIYLYYGVTKEDIRNRTERYLSLVASLAG